jgi:hypothetical protein
MSLGNLRKNLEDTDFYLMCLLNHEISFEIQREILKELGITEPMAPSEPSVRIYFRSEIQKALFHLIS